MEIFIVSEPYGQNEYMFASRSLENALDNIKERKGCDFVEAEWNADDERYRVYRNDHLIALIKKETI